MVWSNPHLQLKREAASWESLPENIKKMILNGERMSVLLAGLPYERFLMYSERIVDGQYVSPTLPRPGRLGKIEKYVLAWAYRQRRAIVSIHTPTVNCALPKSRLMLSYAKNELDIPILGRVHGKSLENSRYTKRQQVFGRMRRLYGVEHSLFGHPLPAGPIRQSYVSFNGVLRRALGSDEYAARE